ncbi:MAG: hypothetical protein ISS59_02795 [Desulfobacteraceae bacterium]|nr:hypothetical protein [Desulfobacteraceae bacterium]
MSEKAETHSSIAEDAFFREFASQKLSSRSFHTFTPNRVRCQYLNTTPHFRLFQGDIDTRKTGSFQDHFQTSY